MKVIVYDLGQLVAQATGNPYRGLEEKNALIVGETHVILVDTEGIHSVYDRNGSINLIDPPTNTQAEILVEGLVNKSQADPVDEVELGTFVRTFGSRLEHNYSLLLETIKKIGLDPANYPRKP